MKHQARNLSSGLEHRLSAYATAASAAGVGILALAQPADAKIVYTPAHQKLPLNQVFYLDLNHDGTNDFGFFARLSGETCPARAATCESWDAADLFLYPQVKGNGVMGKAPYASALRAGAPIGPKAGFNTSRGFMGGVSYFSRAKYSGPWADSGKPVDNRYLGLEFMIKGKIHYGWARLNVRIYRHPKSTVDAVLTGYAYETVPNKRIIAGRTKGPDNRQGSLGALAAGTAGRQ
jgi:hypothetical protein